MKLIPAVMMILLISSSCGVEGELINPRTGEPVQTEGKQGETVVGPEGEQGPAGESVVGPQGEQGSSGASIKGDKGETGSPAPVTTYLCSQEGNKYYITVQVEGSDDTKFEVKKCEVI